MAQTERITDLFRKLINNTCSPGELDEILDWLQSPENQEAAKQLIAQEFSSRPELPDSDTIRERLDNRLQDILRPPVRRSIAPYWWWAAAAVVIAFVARTVLLAPQQVEPSAQQTVQLTYSDPQPGKNGAILTLADGRSLVLDSMADGLVASQGNTHITLNNGRVLYGINKDGSSIPAGMNTLRTPRGRQYQLQLHDGTKVWLNAASSITYPTVFNSKERTVKVTGEVYFEVVKNKAAPFKVELADKTKVEVLGTHFNINAYDTESSFNTTLLEGAVRIRTKNGSPVLMKPGEQVQVHGQEVKLVKNVNLEHVMAWKNGLFSFADANLETVMRQLSRWYDVDVMFEGPVPHIEFNGEIDRNLTLSQVLNGLSATRINYKIKDEKTIVILP